VDSNVQLSCIPRFGQASPSLGAASGQPSAAPLPPLPETFPPAELLAVSVLEAPAPAAPEPVADETGELAELPPAPPETLALVDPVLEPLSAVLVDVLLVPPAAVVDAAVTLAELSPLTVPVEPT